MAETGWCLFWYIHYKSISNKAPLPLAPFKAPYASHKRFKINHNIIQTSCEKELDNTGFVIVNINTLESFVL